MCALPSWELVVWCSWHIIWFFVYVLCSDMHWGFDLVPSPTDMRGIGRYVPLYWVLENHLPVLGFWKNYYHWFPLSFWFLSREILLSDSVPSGVGSFINALMSPQSAGRVLRLCFLFFWFLCDCVFFSSGFCVIHCGWWWQSNGGENYDFVRHKASRWS